MSTATTTQSTASPGGPKVSKFAAKSGFVIPKNKLSGSLVPVFKGGKKPGSNDDASAGAEESVNKVQRKTKWGPDLTQDAAVRRGRALAYQTRGDQIAQQLKSGVLDAEDNQDSQLGAQHDDQSSTNPQVDREKLEFLEFEKQEVIGEILKLNPSYKTSADYKPLLKEAMVPIPVKEYRGYNFLGLIFGPASDTQKRLEKETGAMIQVYGTEADTGEKVEISPSDGNVQSTYEELHIHISADTYEKVDAAADLIELLVTSVRENLAAISTSTLVSGENVNVLGQGQDEGSTFMVPNAAVNQGVPQVVGPMQTPQGQFQYQSPWFPSGPPRTSMLPLNSSAPFLSNPVNMPPLFGPRPTAATGFTPMFQNPSLVSPNSQPPLQVQPYPYMPQIHPSGHTGPPRNFPMPPPQPSSAQPPFTGSQPQPTASLPIGRPLIPSLPQAVSNIPPRPLPDHPLTPTGSSSGWSGAPANVQASLGSSNMGPIAPGIIPPQGHLHVVSQPSVASSAPSNIASGNMVPPSSFPSGPSPTQSSGTALNHPAGPVFASGPPPRVPFAAFPALHPPQVPASAATQPSTLGPVASSGLSISPQSLQEGILSSVSRSTANFSAINPSSATASRPQNPSSGDFIFQPHRPQNLAPITVARPNSQPAMLNTPPSRPMTQLPSPQASSFLLAGLNAAQPVRQVFPRPQVGNQMGQSQVHISSVTFARNPNAPFANLSPVAPTTPVSQMGARNFGTGPQVPNLAGPFPPRLGNPFQLQQNYPSHRNRPENHMGVNQHLNNNPSFSSDKLAPRPRGLQIYDPFSPTSASMRPQHQGGNPAARARKQENDPEYEDLMASVGMK